MPNIEVYKGKTYISSFSLTGDIITIGRARDNDIVLPDIERRISRYHAVLLRNLNDPQRYILRDLSSSWGTRVGGKFIFQKILDAEDTIDICGFHLRYMTLTDKGVSFKIVDELPNVSSMPFPPGISDQDTIMQRLRGSWEDVIHFPSKEMEVLFEEFLSQAESPAKTGSLLNNALDLLFRLLDMEEGCFGCFAMFEEGRTLRCIARKGMESWASISLPMEVVNKIKEGQISIIENRLWTPLRSRKKGVLGFVYLCRGPYAPPFRKDEVELVSIICSIVVTVIEGKKGGTVSEEGFVEWPRDMIGDEQTFREIKRVSQLDTNVLLLGESGVGKDIAAREIHRRSSRQRNVFRKVHCPGLPESLAEGELFGYKKGAFTGATEDKRGEFELADSGTIFLDEIGDLKPELQTKLLGVLEDKVIKRVGEEKERRVNLRIIAATNRDLQKAMSEGKFREDLYYRFGEKITIAPLRERKRDIPLLSHYFLDKFAQERELYSRGITPQAMRCLLSYPWPGNVRELKECINSSLSKSDGIIFIQHLPEQIQRSVRKVIEGEPKSREESEKEHIMEVLQYTRGNKERALEILRVSKQTLYNKMKKYEIPLDFGKELE